MADQVKGKQPRRVFGRTRITLGGKRCTITMTRDKLTVRPFYSHKVWRLPLDKVAMLVLSQGTTHGPDTTFEPA